MTLRNSPFLSSSDSKTNSESRSPQPVHRVVSVTSILCNESLNELFASPVQAKKDGKRFSAKRVVNRIPTNRAKTVNDRGHAYLYSNTAIADSDPAVPEASSGSGGTRAPLTADCRRTGGGTPSPDAIYASLAVPANYAR